MNELDGFKVVSTGKTIGSRDISDFFWKKEDAEKSADEWRKGGAECGVIAWTEYAA
jgi:hypothetical protein